MSPPAMLRTVVGNNSPRYTAIAGYDTPNASPPAMATIHIVVPDVLNDSANKNAPTGTIVAPSMRRPRSSAMRPPTMRPIEAGALVATVNNATSAAEYPRSSFRYRF